MIHAEDRPSHRRKIRGVAYPLTIHDPIYNLHYFPRNKFNAADHRELRQAANTIWRDIAGL
jgi:hypothetical protein